MTDYQQIQQFNAMTLDELEAFLRLNWNTLSSKLQRWANAYVTEKLRVSRLR